MRRSLFWFSLGLAVLLASGPKMLSRAPTLGQLFERPASAAVDPVVTQPMEGPFPSLEHWCELQLTKSACTKGREVGPEGEGAHYHTLSHKCKINEASYQLASDKLAPPYKDVRVVSFKEATELDSVVQESERFYLAVKLPTGFWMSSTLYSCNNNRGMQAEVSRVALDLRTLFPGGARRVVLELQIKESYKDTIGSESEELVILGVGPSGKPRATPPIMSKLMAWKLHEEPSNATYQGREVHMDGAELNYRFPSEGVLEIAQPTKQVGAGISKDALRGLPGRHALNFP